MYLVFALVLLHGCRSEIVQYKNPAYKNPVFVRRDLSDYFVKSHSADDVSVAQNHEIRIAVPETCDCCAEPAAYYEEYTLELAREFAPQPSIMESDADYDIGSLDSVIGFLFVGEVVCVACCMCYVLVCKHNPRRAPRKLVREKRMPARRRVKPQKRDIVVREIPGGAEHTCVVCMDERRNTLLEPCRHLCVCEACAELVDVCPVCRDPFDTTMQVFL